MQKDLKDDGAKRPISISVPLGSGYDREAEEARQRADVVAYARRQLGEPYKFGIESPEDKDLDAWDCSELYQHAFRAAGLHLPDGAQAQYDFCRPVRAPKPGDLGFLWSDKRNMIGHVFVATAEGMVVHAVGGIGVVEDPISLWEHIPRFRGWGRHPDWALPIEERA